MNKKIIFLLVLCISLIWRSARAEDNISAEVVKAQQLLSAYNKLKLAAGDEFMKSISNIQESDFKIEMHDFKSSSQDKSYKNSLNDSAFYAGHLMYKKEFKFTKEDIDHFFNSIDYMLDYAYLDYIIDRYYAASLLDEKFDIVLNLYLLNRFKKYLILLDRVKINSILMRVKIELKNIDKFSTLQKLEIECLLPTPMIDISEIQKTFLRLQSPLEFKKLSILDYPKSIYLVNLMRQYLGSVSNEMKTFLETITPKLAMLLEPDGCLPLIFDNKSRRNYRYEVYLANKYLQNSGFTYIANGGLKNYKGYAPESLVYEDENLFSYRTNWNFANVKNRSAKWAAAVMPFMVTYNRVTSRLSLYGYNRTLLLIQLKESQEKVLSKVEDSPDDIKIVINDLNIMFNKKTQTIVLESKAIQGSTAFIHLSKAQNYKSGVVVPSIEKVLKFYNEYTIFIDKTKFNIECDHSIINENDTLQKEYNCSFIINSNKLTIEKVNEETDD